MSAPFPVVKQSPSDITPLSSEHEHIDDALCVDDPTPSHTTSDDADSDQFVINVKVVVYAALSGMISFLPDGSIHGCNNQFTTMLFGYSQEELLKKVDIVHVW